jgi:hypothetical protein
MFMTIYLISISIYLVHVLCLHHWSTYLYLSRYGYVLLQVVRESVVVCVRWFLMSVCVIVFLWTVPSSRLRERVFEHCDRELVSPWP